MFETFNIAFMGGAILTVYDTLWRHKNISENTLETSQSWITSLLRNKDTEMKNKDKTNLTCETT